MFSLCKEKSNKFSLSSPTFADWSATLILFTSFFQSSRSIFDRKSNLPLIRYRTLLISQIMPSSFFCSQSRYLCFCSTSSCYLPGTKYWLPIANFSSWFKLLFPSFSHYFCIVYRSLHTVNPSILVYYPQALIICFLQTPEVMLLS